MRNIVIIYGAVAGAIAVTSIIIGLQFGDDVKFLSSVAFGYLSMLVALSLIFIGVKKYRDEEFGGVIKFLPALLAGLSIAVVAGVIYVLIWELYSMRDGYAYIETYATSMIEAKKAAGVTGAALEQEIANAEALKAQYRNPLFRWPLTFMEIFPVGMIIAFLSAAVLRNPKILPARG